MLNACKCEVLCHAFRGGGRTNMEMRRRRYGVRWHVYMSVGGAIATVSAENGAKAGRWLCALAGL
jgi:hypothetical protein